MGLTKLAEVGDALESLLTTALAAQTPAIPVYRGAQWLTSDSPAAFAAVAHDGSLESMGLGGTEEQEPAGMGGGWRTARGDLTCALVDQSTVSTGAEMAARRARVESWLDLIDVLLRVNPTMSGLVQFGWLASVTAFEDPRAARYTFVWHYEVDV